ncbi:MAG TPA: tetratricopeptide repeat protein [Urbifossiella sp.]|nr:tetratricopeptide repeat protein [Urbifossiella sp.]
MTADPRAPSSEPAPPPPGRRAWRGWFVLAAFLIVAAAVGGWRYRVTRPDYQLARGEEAIRAENWADAGRAIDRLEAAGAADHAAVLRGEYFLATGRPDLALEAFREVKREGPFHLRSATKAGRCLLAVGNLAEADRVLSYVLDAEPDNVDARRSRAAVAYDLGQMPAAVADLEAVARLDPADARPHRLMGLINKDLNRYEQAEAAYRESLRRGLAGAARGEVVAELAEVLNRAGKFADALAVFDADPPAPGPAGEAVRVEALRGVARRADAAAAADRSIAAHPVDGVLRRLRGQLHLDEGNAAAAVAALEAAAARLPADYQTQFLLAQAYAATGRAPESARAAARAEELRKTLERATALTREAMDRPWDAAVRLELATVTEALGEPKLAAMWRAAAAACRGR